jgi:hypothetical protein
MTRVQHVYRHRDSGRYYVRGYRQGKEIWKALKTTLTAQVGKSLDSGESIPPPSEQSEEGPPKERLWKERPINEKALEAISRFTDVQAKQIELRHRELELSGKELSQAHEFSTKSLELQHEPQRGART